MMHAVCTVLININWPLMFFASIIFYIKVTCSRRYRNPVSYVMLYSVFP